MLTEIVPLLTAALKSRGLTLNKTFVLHLKHLFQTILVMLTNCLHLRGQVRRFSM